MITREIFMDIIALHRQGHSIRSISRKLGIHRNTVKKYLEGKSFPQYQRYNRQDTILTPYSQTIKDFLEEDDYKATWIYDRLKNMGYEGSYDTVKNYVRKYKKQQNQLAYIRFETEPGKQAQVDWGDFQIREPNGKTTTVHAFAMVLGYSRAMYVEFVESCTMENFMDSHIHAFNYLNGIPAEILYDNMKNVVIRKLAGNTRFNREFLHFANHYSFCPRACPPYSPWVKGKVERPIDYIRERFWRGYTFVSIQKANKDIKTWLNQTANRRVHGTHHQVVNDRWEKEIPHLLELPASDYDTSIKVFRKVYRDCQLSYRGNRYIVPYHVVGKTVMLKIKKGLIRIYHDQELLASYQEKEDRGNTVGGFEFYEQLRRDKEQIQRKYGRNKGKATRGLTTGSLYLNVFVRPLSEYERYTQEVSWNS